MRRTPEYDDTIFLRTKLLPPKSTYTPFSAHITPKKLAPLLILSDTHPGLSARQFNGCLPRREEKRREDTHPFANFDDDDIMTIPQIFVAVRIPG